MANAELAMRFNASADRVWGVLTGPDMVKLLLDAYAAKVDVEMTDKGPTFMTTLKDGGVVRERIDALDPEERSMKYHVLDAGPLPYANYRGEARVQPHGPNACVLSFQCTFIPVEKTEAEVRNFWLDHNRHVMQTLKKFVEGS